MSKAKCPFCKRKVTVHDGNILCTHGKGFDFCKGSGYAIKKTVKP